MGCVYTTEITLNTQHLIDVLDMMWMFLLECCDKCLQTLHSQKQFTKVFDYMAWLLCFTLSGSFAALVPLVETVRKF